MLPTFVILLREGLEAALIVSIIATFLRRNSASLRGMWIGVSAGVALSIGIGLLLDLVEESLPQREQEGMETVIALVAVVMVTGMIVWMRQHARHLKRDLESAAADAMASGTTAALAVMAFLAVLREGFETSVFLLATIQNASSAPAALAGAVLGLASAVVLGWLIYAGGVRLNLQRFFSYTGIFLVFVAAGLVLFAARTAHEAGWLNIGQSRTVDLFWLAPNGSVRAALFTGVLGIQPDPRVVEVLAWACYLVPMLVLMYLPDRLGPRGPAARRLTVATAGVLAVGAAVLALAVPPAATARPQLPRTLDLTALTTYTDGRVPVGINPQTAPGPYAATWVEHGSHHILTLSEGGLATSRTFTVDVPTAPAADPGNDRPLWRRWFPLSLLVAAAALLGQALRRRTPSPMKGHHVPSNA
ncbi:iron uptake transporter permease EfeU [Nocardioides montaniterrae]